MCPQLPRGFWSGGSNSCSLTMNTNAQHYWILLLYSKQMESSGKQMPKQSWWRWGNLHRHTKSDKTVDCPLVQAVWLCLCLTYGWESLLLSLDKGIWCIFTTDCNRWTGKWCGNQKASQLLDSPFVHDTQCCSRMKRMPASYETWRHPCHSIYSLLCCYYMACIPQIASSMGLHGQRKVKQMQSFDYVVIKQKKKWAAATLETPKQVSPTFVNVSSR